MTKSVDQLAVEYAGSQKGNVVCGLSMEKAFIAGWLARDEQWKEHTEYNAVVIANEKIEEIERKLTIMEQSRDKWMKECQSLLELSK